MRNPAAELLASLESEARALQSAETELRKRLQREIEALARRRAFAYRRTRLVTLLVNEAARSQEADYRSTQRRAVSEALGWDASTEANARILDELAQVGDAVWRTLSEEGGNDKPAPLAALAEFEQWFETTYARSFYALFDEYVTEVPVVDF